MLFTPNYDPTIRIRPRNTFPNPWCPIYVSRSKLQPQFPDPRWQEWQLVCCSLNHLLSYSDLHHAYMRKCTELLPSDWLFRYAAWQQSVHWSCLDNLVLKKMYDFLVQWFWQVTDPQFIPSRQNPFRAASGGASSIKTNVPNPAVVRKLHSAFFRVYKIAREESTFTWEMCHRFNTAAAVWADTSCYSLRAEHCTGFHNIFFSSY